jgi:translation initiation factor IF-2
LDKKTNRLRIYDIAKEYKISSDALMKVLRGLGFTIKSHMSIASEDMLEAIADKFKHEIAEVKKDDEARKRKLLELEAHKRREEAEKQALLHKAEAAARKKKALVEKKAKERAAKELAEAKKEIVIPAPPEPVVEKPRAEVPVVKATVVPAPPMEKRRPTVKEAVKEPPRKEPRRPEPTAQHRPAAVVPKIRVSPEAAQKLEKRLQQSTAVSKAEKRRKKRDRGKKGRAAHVVDQEAVTLAFKKTMASIDGVKKVKKYKKRSAEDDTPEEETQTVEVTEFMTISELAKVLDHRPAELVAKCLELGVLASINQRLDIDTIETLALEFGYGVRQVEEIGTAVMEEEDEENLQFRPPVVTIMGHVDHGKTTLLDYIRKSNIAAGEAGEITQHIGAYAVQSSAGRITFLDTPGHEAFSAMRARGAQVTDIVILVVSAVEAVMPQTVEAINHAKAANVPIIVAINKMDLPGANPDSVRQQLANLNLLDESWGGKTIMVEVSAKKGTGVDKLLEMIILQSEMMELKADPDIKAQGAIIEARLEKGRGPVVTLLVQKGTLWWTTAATKWWRSAPVCPCRLPDSPVSRTRGIRLW